jgi:hypothetical protein
MFVWLVSSLKWGRSENSYKIGPLMFVWLVSSTNGVGVKMVKKLDP